MSNRSHSNFLFWNIWNTKTFFEAKVFETNIKTFFRTNLLRPILRLWDQIFWDRRRDFFLDQIFLRPILSLFSETENFRDQYGDFFRGQIFRERYWYSQKNEKSHDTKKSRDKMSHSEHVPKGKLDGAEKEYRTSERARPGFPAACGRGLRGLHPSDWSF